MIESLFPYEWIVDAVDRIQPYTAQTPIIYDNERDLYLKCENRQITGSFKVRGAINKALTLQPWEQEHGLVAASAGNHGQGVRAGRENPKYSCSKSIVQPLLRLIKSRRCKNWEQK